MLDTEDLKMIKRMCNTILGEYTVSKELDSLAFFIGHHPDILGAEDRVYTKNNNNTLTQ
jgi:hypothetical protein